MCGTLDYLTPEMVPLLIQIQYSGYSHRVDIWSLGVLCYELCTGTAPFQTFDEGETKKKIQNVIFKFKMDFIMPDYLSEDCQDLINNLIVKDKEKRIKLDQVLMHPWIQKNTSN